MTHPRALRPAVFLDRDDTLIANSEATAGSRFPGSLFDPALVRLLPGAGAACRSLHDAGYALVVVTNQGAVARGECTLEHVDATNLRLREAVRDEAGVDLDAVYACPYHPQGSVAPWNVEHHTRKPGPGMLLEAARDLGLDLSSSWMVGDAERDIEAALAAGVPVEHTIVVGHAPTSRVGLRVGSLAAAAAVILGAGHA